MDWGQGGLGLEVIGFTDWIVGAAETCAGVLICSGWPGWLDWLVLLLTFSLLVSALLTPCLCASVCMLLVVAAGGWLFGG